MKELTILEELKNLLPALTEEEFAGLEASILKDGCLSPLVVWNDILVDGHHRYEICRKHQIPYAIKNVELENLEDAKLWAWQHQENRRNLTKFLRAELALKFKDVLAAKAKERQRAAGGDRKSEHAKSLTATLPEAIENKETRQELAAAAEIGSRTLDKAEYILNNADEDTKNKLRRGEKGTSINKEYNRLKGRESSSFQGKSKKAPKADFPKFVEPLQDSVTSVECFCRPGEKPGATGKPYVTKSNLGDLPHDQPEILVAQLIAHFPRAYTTKILFLIFDALRANDGNTVTEQLANEIWHEFGKH